MDYSKPMLRDNALKDEVIIVTGGGSGLGKAMSTYFLELGAKVVITSRNLDKLLTTAQEAFDGMMQLADNLLVDPAARARHAQAIADLVVQNLYTGINIAYYDINPELRQEFSVFIRDLALDFQCVIR